MIVTLAEHHNVNPECSQTPDGDTRPYKPLSTNRDTKTISSDGCCGDGDS